MPWYTAVLVVECAVGDGPPDTRDLAFHLVEAGDHEEAYDRAIALGPVHETEYSNEAGEIVRWTFRGLSELAMIDGPPGDGTEVYSFLSEEPTEDLVLPKQKLEAFWFEANKHRAARELLDEEPDR